MNYIVLDLEWNQSAYKVDEEENLPFEIIEIGAVKLDAGANIVDSFQELIRPQVYPFLLRRTKQITGWTDKDLDQRGIYFEDAVAKFLTWCGEDYLFCVWGGSDLTQLERNMEYYKIRIPWKYPLKYLDVQKLYALESREGKNRRTLESVVEIYGIPEDGDVRKVTASGMSSGILVTVPEPEWPRTNELMMMRKLDAQTLFGTDDEVAEVVTVAEEVLGPEVMMKLFGAETEP